MTAAGVAPTPRPGKSPFADSGTRIAAGVHGMNLFLLALAILFAATLIGYAVIRLGYAAEAPDAVASLPPLPRLLWLSTVLLVGSSATMHLALRGARAGRRGRLRAGMAATTALGLAFLAVQAVCWIQWSSPFAESLAETEQAFLVTAFYVLTGLHAAHLIGGLVPLLIVTRNAWAGRYGPGDDGGILYCAMYWHFLDAVWIVLFATLMLGVRN